MSEEDKDVIAEEEDTSSDSSTEEEASIEQKTEDNTSDTAEEESDTSEDEESDDDDDSGGDDEESELGKLKKQVENLNIALRKERESKRSSISDTQASIQQETSTTAKTQAQTKESTQEQSLGDLLVYENERSAMKELYSEYPDIAPENDTTNEKYNQFAAVYKGIVQSRGGQMPVTKEGILEVGRIAMRAISPEKIRNTVSSEKDKADRTKGKAGNLETGKSVRKEKKQVSASDADRRAAKAAGMTLERYLENKNFYDQDSLEIV